MPKAISDFLGYKIFIWSNDHKPPHFHIDKGVPNENSTRVLITRDGFEFENSAQIPANDRKKLLRYFNQNRGKLLNAWYKIHGDL